MAKEYTVELGGKPRKLRFTQGDARALYQQFQKPLNGLFWDDVLGIKDERFGAAFNPVAFHAALFLALKHDSPALTAEKLDEWVGAHLSEGKALVPLIIAVMSAACIAGITNGVSFDFEEYVQKNQEDLGKAQEPKSPEPAPIEG